MNFKEKSVWIMAIATALAYAGYTYTVLGRASDTPLPEVSYIPTLLWSVGIVIVVSIIGHILVAVLNPDEAGIEDQRDHDIERHGEFVGHWAVAFGAIGAMALAMFEMSHFWIANLIYLAFVIGTLVGCTAKLIAYRRGF